MKSDKRKRFIFCEEWKENIDDLPESEQLAVYRAICDYGFEGNDTSLADLSAKSGLWRIVIREIRRLMDYHKARYDCGKRGGRKPCNPPKNNLDVKNNPPKNNLDVKNNPPKNNVPHIHVHTHVHDSEHESFIPFEKKEKKENSASVFNHSPELEIFKMLPESTHILFGKFLASRTQSGDPVANDPYRQEILLKNLLTQTEVFQNQNWDTVNEWIENAIENNLKKFYPPFPKKVETPHDARKQEEKAKKEQERIIAEIQKQVDEEDAKSGRVTPIRTDKDADLFLRNTP